MEKGGALGDLLHYLFIPVTAGTSRPRGGQFMVCDGGVKGPPSTNHNTSPYLSLHTPPLK